MNRNSNDSNNSGTYPVHSAVSTHHTGHSCNNRRGKCVCSWPVGCSVGVLGGKSFKKQFLTVELITGSISVVYMHTCTDT